MMQKYSFLFTLLFWLSAVTIQTSQAQSQLLREDILEKSEQNILLIEKICTAITQNCDPVAIQEYEANILQAIDSYLKKCLHSDNSVSKTQELETQAIQFLDYLLKTTTKYDAYMITSMLFMINWSKRINEIAVELEDPEQVDNLQKAIEQVHSMVKRVLLEPMAKLIEDNQ